MYLYIHVHTYMCVYTCTYMHVCLLLYVCTYVHCAYLHLMAVVCRNRNMVRVLYFSDLINQCCRLLPCRQPPSSLGWCACARGRKRCYNCWHHRHYCGCLFFCFNSWSVNASRNITFVYREDVALDCSFMGIVAAVTFKYIGSIPL